MSIPETSQNGAGKPPRPPQPTNRLARSRAAATTSAADAGVAPTDRTTTGQGSSGRDAGDHAAERIVHDWGSVDRDCSHEVFEAAATIFDADEMRSDRRATATAALAALPLLNAGDSDAHEQVQRLRAEAEPIGEKPAETKLSQFVKAGALRFWSNTGLLLLILWAGMRNAMYLLEQSGLGIEAFSSASLALASVVGFVPGLLSKWALSGLGDKRRRIWERALKTVALPLAAAGLAMFAIVLGKMNGDVNVFEADSTWAPPFWVLVAVAQALEVLASIALFLAAEKEFGLLCPRTLVDGPMHVAATERARRLGCALGAAAARKARHEAEVKRLDSERTAWCLHVLSRYQAYRQLLRQEQAVEEATWRLKQLQKRLG